MSTSVRESANPIGVFDSGVGGLSVLREIRTELPNEALLYVADSAHIPYGDKSSAFIEERAIAISEFLIAQDAKAIVVACNTATSAAIAALRARYSIPIVGMEPAVKPAVNATRSGIVGVLATNGTLAGDKFAELAARFGASAEILIQPCPGLVEQIEAGELSSERSRSLVAEYVSPLVKRGADVIVLGCTHYPFLMPLIKEIAGDTVTIVDPSPAVARELRRRLENAGLLRSDAPHKKNLFWTSGSAEKNAPLISRLWGESVAVHMLPSS